MAEIKIEKKKPVWPWILLGLIILAIILYFVFTDNTDDVDDFDDDTEQVTDTTFQDNQMMDRDTIGWNNDTIGGVDSQSVSRYIAHVDDTTRMGVDHEYTNNALVHLINAVEAKADERNIDLNTDLEEIRTDAQQITQNPQATNHADKIKSAGSKIAEALEKIQQEGYPNLSEEVQEVKTAVQEIESSTLTLEQKDRINSFFKEAADVLRNMS